MEVTVLGVRQVAFGKAIAHVQAGELFGDCPCNPKFSGTPMPSPGVLTDRLRVKDGRLEKFLFVEVAG